MHHYSMNFSRNALAAGVAALFLSGVWAQSEPDGEFGVTDETIVASVGGEDMTAEQVEALRAGLPDQMRRSMQGMDNRAFLNAYANMLALERAAVEEGYDQQEPFNQQLEYLRMQFLGEIFMTRYNATLEVPENIKKDFYDVNERVYAQINTSAIYIDFTSGNGPTGMRNEEDARALADKVVAELRAGASFPEMAKRYSDDEESREKGGFLGEFTAESQLPAQLKNVILRLPEGEISAPVRDNARFYIFRADSRSARPYDEVKEDVEQRLRGLMFRRKLEEVRESVKVEYKNDDFLNRRPFPGSARP